MENKNRGKIKEFFHSYFASKKEEIRNYGKVNLIKRICTIVATTIIAILFIVLISDVGFQRNDYTIMANEVRNGFTRMVKARVESVDEVYYPDEEEHLSYTVRITFSAKILKGEEKGQVVSVNQYFNDFTKNLYREVKKGQTIYMFREAANEDDIPTYYFSGDSISYNHWGGIIALIIILVILLLIVSKSKGLLTIISLTLTILVIVYVMLPSILLGRNIYVFTIICSVFVITVTFIIVVGINKKCLCASLGCFSGLVLSGLLTILTMSIIHATGYYVQESAHDVIELSQTYYNINIVLDFKGFVFASTIIGALGAVMDVSLSLSSALKEVYDNSKETSVLHTIKSGFVIGKDMIGTMVNTLVLAYVASDLAFVLCLMAHHSNEFILRSEYIAVAIAQALVGSIAMVLTIPLTSIICAIIYNKKDKKENISMEEE